MLARFAFLVLTMLLLTQQSLRAEDPVAAAQAVVSRQIAAFLAEDEAAAFADAAPNMRNGITDSTKFLEMVRARYKPVYVARNYAFGRSKLVGGGELVLQEVMVADREGRDWTAIFEVRLMDDGVYKINGIRLLRNSSSQGI